MTREDFGVLVRSVERFDSDVIRIVEFGFDLSRYSLLGCFGDMVRGCLLQSYSEAGYELFVWYCYESENRFVGDRVLIRGVDRLYGLMEEYRLICAE